MKLLADEGVDSAIVRVLRQDGHDVEYIAEVAAGSSDISVLEQSFQNNRLLLTLDKDFGELVFRLKNRNIGVVLIRLFGFSPESKASTVKSVLEKYQDELLNSFTVIQPGLVRVRRRGD